ncbi:ATP-grasp domain-containing protein [Domibacillus sp. DTU_2020_1001157_1_SI_ALB_TIR_016]|uniref:ATP-grasp domain-containing protein n=1 Tax=Domibacillus sp. DTU_2020_1001157_1_SI_ALB_TIR_016 TaxID=3077789 RepID=UPI0028E522D1|nr:ATP-grasp domain-containing protein [Domibacillus sp. DTU_2020_1001157_1_SI_ALB_TIR_016]WNS80305.1 ATP-grasp domain-containing protein [Domibacillus sp. DTU_2020_1001157_1_SI_ALB_TIR_016]
MLENREVQRMKTIVFIGVNKSSSSREAVKAAEKAGYFTVVFTNREIQMQQREKYPDVHQLIFADITNVDMLAEHIEALQEKGHVIAAVVSFVDRCVHTASLLADRFCDNVLSTEAIFIMENKEETRKHFAHQPYTPAFFLVESGIPVQDMVVPVRFTYPVMVKYPKSTGSKDVLLSKNKWMLRRNIIKLREKYPGEDLIVEEYIKGEQYLFEVIVYKGEIMIAAVIEQEITKGRRFIITGYGVMTDIPDEIEESVWVMIESIVASLDIQNGAFHIEARWTVKGWKLVEINPRISGGAMNKMIEAAFGYSLVEETLKMLTGGAPSLKRRTNRFVFTQYVIVGREGILEKVTGKRRAESCPGVIEVYVKPKRGTILVPPLSMGHRYAYVMAVGETMQEAKASAKNAAREIQFYLRER